MELPLSEEDVMDEKSSPVHQDSRASLLHDSQTPGTPNVSTSQGRPDLGGDLGPAAPKATTSTEGIDPPGMDD